MGLLHIIKNTILIFLDTQKQKKHLGEHCSPADVDDDPAAVAAAAVLPADPPPLSPLSLTQF